MTEQLTHTHTHTHTHTQKEGNPTIRDNINGPLRHQAK